MTWYKISWYLQFLELTTWTVRDETEIKEFTESIIRAGFTPTVEIYEGDYRPLRV